MHKAIAMMVVLAGCSPAPPPPPCPRGFTLCQDRCVDTTMDADHCGACETSCAGGRTCRASECRLSCAAGFLACADTCVDPLTNGEHCGATGACTDPLPSTPDSVGAACGPSRFCTGGVCVDRCPSGFLACGTRCIDPAWDGSFCGARGDCTDPGLDSSNSRGEFCGDLTYCVNGGCGYPCDAPRGVSCGAVCIDPQTDPNHCGARGFCDDVDPRSRRFRGAQCPAPTTCIGGHCVP